MSPGLLQVEDLRVQFTTDDGIVHAVDGISYSVELTGQASESDLAALVNHVDVIAEIPNSLRQGTPVTLDRVHVAAS